MPVGVQPVDRWSDRMIASVQAEVDRLGPDANLSARKLEAMGVHPQMAARVVRWRTSGRTTAPADIAQPAVSDDDMSVSTWGVSSRTKQPGFTKQRIAEDDLVEEAEESILARAEARFQREAAIAKTQGPRKLAMPAGPYAVVHIGDPHLDDPGCDIPALKLDVKTIAATPGMYGANLGDSMNLWVGSRLTELYANQTITLDEGFILARWMARVVKRWPYWLYGNHDKWRGGAGRLRQMLESDDLEIGVMQADDIRVELVSPNGTSVKIHARHDFPGGSQFSHTHALKRAALWDGWADVYAAGHRHVAEVRQEEGADGRFRTLLRARGYKRFDDYAREKGFHEQTHGASITTVVDPEQAHVAERIRAFWSVQEAAEHLTWLRRRRGVA